MNVVLSKPLVAAVTVCFAVTCVLPCSVVIAADGGDGDFAEMADPIDDGSALAPLVDPAVDGGEADADADPEGDAGAGAGSGGGGGSDDGVIIAAAAGGVILVGLVIWAIVRAKRGKIKDKEIIHMDARAPLYERRLSESTSIALDSTLLKKFDSQAESLDEQELKDLASAEVSLRVSF